MALKNRFMVKIHIHSPILKASSLKKNENDNLISLVAREGEKIAQKGKRCRKNYFLFKQISKCDTYLYIYLSRAFQKYWL